MIHRAPFGSLERLIGILIEQYAGDFPFWLSPVQLRLLTVTASHMPYAEKVAAQLQAKGIRVEVDRSGDRLGKKIRNAEKAKIPIMAVIGDQEMESESLNIRTRTSQGDGDIGSVSLENVETILLKAMTDYCTWKEAAVDIL